ncbi:hypothetical protein Q1695_006960 [Nippostrongylus brasiliensis]|nr:hypothetical protein Q1695_006960 [Nippostrongylus brasiliensis]
MSAIGGAVVNASPNPREAILNIADSIPLFSVLDIQLVAAILSLPALVVTIQDVIRFQLLHRSTRFLLLLYLIGSTREKCSSRSYFPSLLLYSFRRIPSRNNQLPFPSPPILGGITQSMPMD